MRNFVLAVILSVSFNSFAFAQDDVYTENSNSANTTSITNSETEPQPLTTSSDIVSEKTSAEITPTTQTAAAEIDCATSIFANSIYKTAGSVSENDTSATIQEWIYKNFENADNVRSVLNCPEVSKLNDEDVFKFQRIEYNFPQGRQVVINYTTQPRILKQKLQVATKRSLPDSNPSPRVGDPKDSAIWTNTEPAWYGILVVKKGSLDTFVGENKNNTISLDYIKSNIDKIYPDDSGCTSKTALAKDTNIINLAVHKSVNIQDDTNDYYVAGDANLQWIAWGEVALDVAITVATVGTGTAVLGATKVARATKNAKNLVKSIKELEQVEKVKNYISASQKAAKAAEELKALDKTKDAAEYTRKSEEIAKLGDDVKELEKVDDVKKYKESSQSFENVMKLRRELKAWKIPQRGNVIARTWKSINAIGKSEKILKNSEKVAKAGMRSGKIRDFLFRSTMKNVGRLAKMERAGGILYGTMKFVGDMYDFTETSTGDFTNNIQFKPLGLLSADDLNGQENVVNYGMWLMWAGDSKNPTDDDAAYLQAFDFASKFHEDLNETQSNNNGNCNVDIYVVRPIIRNPDSEDAALYYLIMNDKPWSVEK